jgi:hypothetical protein
MNRVGVVGTLVWDRIWTHEALRGGGAPTEDWGGITYSLAAWAAACPPGWEVVPVLKVGEDLLPEFFRFADPLPNLRLPEGILAVPEPTNRVELRYHDPANRCEQLTGGVPRWRWEELAPRLERLDALYVNFISGFEMEIDVAEQLRRGFGGPIYADLHSLFLGRLPDGRRVPRPLPDAERWLRCFDAVQVNQDESTLLAGEGKGLDAVAALAMERGARLLLVTQGEAGAEFVVDPALPADPLRWPAHRGDAPTAPRRERVPLRARVTDGDPTGCGDVWGATVFASLLGGAAVERAVRSANAAAARSVAHCGTAGLFDHLRTASFSR